MMNLLEAILSARNGGVVDQVAGQFGLSREDASSAMAALLPALAGGLQRNMSSSGGLESLLQALGSGHHSQYIDDTRALSRPETTLDGNAILGHLLGCKDVSRQVAAHASQQTGLSSDLLKRMLPIVASLAMGALSQQAAPRRMAATGSMPPPDALGSLSQFIDLNRDGSMADETMGFVRGLFSGR
jgi:hypothetical protein